MRLKNVLLVIVLLAVLAVLSAFRTNLVPRRPDLLSAKELSTRVAGARTREDHLQLARHYRALAALKKTEAYEYYALAEQYLIKVEEIPEAERGPLSGKTAEHCGYIADSIYEAGKFALDLAADHEKIAAK